MQAAAAMALARQVLTQYRLASVTTAAAFWNPKLAREGGAPNKKALGTGGAPVGAASLPGLLDVSQHVHKY